MMDNKRILALEMDNALFEQLDDYVRNNGLSKKQYVAELIRADLAEKLKQEQGIKDPEIVNAKGWERGDVEEAIKDFILQNGRAPGQKEFRNENGLPSYGAASRALEYSPSQYAKQRAMEILNVGAEEEMQGQTMLGM